jgi:hypothetical protein
MTSEVQDIPEAYIHLIHTKHKTYTTHYNTYIVSILLLDPKQVNQKINR